MSRPKPWPRLSVQLPGERHPAKCQSCAQEWDLTTWQECDDKDMPEHTFVVLCDTCSDRLIEPHPRLYIPWTAHKPYPGIMAELCGDCALRDGLDCTSPLRIANGGPGMKVEAAQGGRFHWHGADAQGAHAAGIWETWFPSRACTGKDISLPATNLIPFKPA